MEIKNSEELKVFKDQLKKLETVNVGLSEEIKALKDEQKKSQTIIAGLSGKVALFEKEIVKFKKDKFVGKWSLVERSGKNTGIWCKYYMQFGSGFFRSMSDSEYVEFEIDGEKLKLTYQFFAQKIASSPEFVFGREYEWTNHVGDKYKLLINNIDGVKLTGKEIRMEDGKMCNTEMVMEPDGKLMLTMDGVWWSQDICEVHQNLWVILREQLKDFSHLLFNVLFFMNSCGDLFE